MTSATFVGTSIPKPVEFVGDDKFIEDIGVFIVPLAVRPWLFGFDVLLRLLVGPGAQGACETL